LGICNGFQILVEAGLLPGAVLRNSTLRFRVHLDQTKGRDHAHTIHEQGRKGQVLEIPIAHNEGRYYLDKEKIPELERNQQIVFRYVSEEKESTEGSQPERVNR